MKLQFIGVLAVAAISLGLAGCGGNACDDAADKWKECTGASADGDTGDCDGANKCAAECMNNASCDDINASLTGMDNAFVQCTLNCAF